MSEGLIQRNLPGMYISSLARFWSSVFPDFGNSLRKNGIGSLPAGGGFKRVKRAWNVVGSFVPFGLAADRRSRPALTGPITSVGLILPRGAPLRCRTLDWNLAGSLRSNA